MVDVLVLNASHEALQVLPLRKALKLIFKGAAQVQATVAGRTLHTVDSHFEMPSVILLRHYVRYNSKPVAYSKRNVLERDNHVCQYCSAENARTVDHIIPQSKGGPNTFENTVACCNKCNNHKSDNSLAKSGLTLARKPKKPSRFMFMRAVKGRPEWHKYLFM